MPEMNLERRKYLRNGERWVTINEVVYCRLWFEFLVFSPSYELARKHRAGTLTDSDQARLPADFADVLAVFDDLGDIQRITFDDWWLDKGFRFFGYQGEQPRVGVIDVLFRENPAQLETLLMRGAEYINERWSKQGQQPSAIVAIPLSLTKAQMAQHLEHALAPYKEKLSYLTPQPPKYGLHGRKRDTNSLFRYMKCLLVKAQFPEIKLYQIGAVAGLSSTYSSRFEENEDIEDRHALKILTSRAISRGLMIAENAARGIFPSYNRNEHAVAPNWEEMRHIIDSRGDWLDSL
ncbi:hypothetical protein [Sphingobium fuliginis]|uniref:Uncharacterized protein n=1 Tax=Sphingobium fuliginis ATCC 27551 TaxID=1208342 RepID=A0A5B8CKC7_SPHSA|nr:hypothetical protein [Sphingobium fuliginis]QDC38706.1 hypothetical protein FIL70_17115 [Sphingobium fuliginis ATCC 27551]